MKHKKRVAPLLAVLFALSLSTPAAADTIHLRDGTVIHGQIIAFKDQQFIVLIGSGSRGRRSRVTLVMEDVESIDFDSNNVAGNNPTDETGGANDNLGNNTSVGRTASTDTNPPIDVRPAAPDAASANNRAAAPSSRSPVFFPIKLRVRADNTTNGWNDSGLMVRRGQRLRVSASGRVSLGGGVYSTPAGLPRLTDKDKLMRDEPTGALIAVIGDDNDDFILLGSNREFTARRDGRLFLGVNEGNLNDNSGAYDVSIQAEALAGAPR